MSVALETFPAPIKVAGLTIDVVDVTPEMAASWLKTAARNRKIRRDFVRQLTADIRAGNWILNGAPFRFDTNDRLIDGQHRATAIVAAGATVQSVVIWGIPAIANDTVDQGLARKFADSLAMRGEKYYALVAAATAWRANYDSRTLPARDKYSVTTLNETLNRNPGIRAGAEWVVGAQKTNPLIPSIAVFGYSVFGGLSVADRGDFLHKLVTGEAINSEDPVLVLRNALTSARQKIRRPTPVMQAAWMIKAWNATRDGESLKVVRYNPWKEDFPIAC